GSLQANMSPPVLFRYEALNDDYRELYNAHTSCKDLSQRLADTQNKLVGALRSQAALSDDHKALKKVHLVCAGKLVTLLERLTVVEKEKDDLLDRNKDQEEQIKRLEEALASKTCSLFELLPTVVQRLLSINEYKNSLSEPFDQAITVRWLEGMKVGQTEEASQAVEK
ncbi:hypothetical protein Tco_1488349, partial [Tanacetum coccineum]